MSAEGYARIGGGSPILKYTTGQANLLENALREGAEPNTLLSNAKCYVAMRYFKPYTEQAMQQMERDGITQLVILPLYPHYSISTSGSSFKKLKQEFSKNPEQWSPENFPQTVVPAWYYRSGYVNVRKLAVQQHVCIARCIIVRARLFECR
jgi:ferrochelatase